MANHAERIFSIESSRYAHTASRPLVNPKTKAYARESVTEKLKAVSQNIVNTYVWKSSISKSEDEEMKEEEEVSQQETTETTNTPTTTILKKKEATRRKSSRTLTTRRKTPKKTAATVCSVQEGQESPPSTRRSNSHTKPAALQSPIAILPVQVRSAQRHKSVACSHVTGGVPSRLCSISNRSTHPPLSLPPLGSRRSLPDLSSLPRISLSIISHSKKKSLANSGDNKTTTDAFPANSIVPVTTLDPNFIFQTIQMNQIESGTNSYQRAFTNVFLKSLNYTLIMKIRNAGKGCFVRYGFFYDKCSNGKDIYQAADLFETLGFDPTGTEVSRVSDVNSFRNIAFISRLLVLVDKTVNFGINKSFPITPGFVTPVNVVSTPANFFSTTSTLSLEPLVTVYNPASGFGDSKNIQSGNLVFWFLASNGLNTVDTVNLDLTMTTRLYFVETDEGLVSWRQLTYLANPLLMDIAEEIFDKQSSSSGGNNASPLSSTLSLINKSEYDVRGNINMFSTAYQILYSLSHPDAFSGIEHSVCNGLCYLKASQISELKYIDFLYNDASLCYTPLSYSDPATELDPLYIHLINDITNGETTFQRTNSKVRNMQIDWRVTIDTGKVVTTPSPSGAPGTPEPLVLTIALIYDKAPFIDPVSAVNVTPSVLNMFSSVDFEGNLITSPFKTVEFSKRFVIIEQKQVLLDTVNFRSGVFLGTGCSFFEGRSKLYQSDSQQSPLVDAVLSPDIPTVSNTKESSQLLQQGYVTEFNPAKMVNGVNVYNQITYGAIYMMVKTQVLADEYIDLLKCSISTRTFYYD